MTKQEAIAEMQKGNKVTHTYFTSDEWMTIEDSEILFEDGVKCSIALFFHDRAGEAWENGYELWFPY